MTDWELWLYEPRDCVESFAGTGGGGGWLKGSGLTNAAYGSAAAGRHWRCPESGAVCRIGTLEGDGV